MIDLKTALTAKLAVAFCILSLSVAPAQTVADDQSRNISLTVPAGVPLRLYLTKRVSKRAGAPVQARLLTSVYAFDREVIPAGTQVLGHVSRLEPVSKWMRMRAVVGGDFTPLHVAEVEFTSMVPPGGSPVEIHTIESAGLNSLFPLKPPRKRGAATQAANGLTGAAKQNVQDAFNAQVDRIRSIPDMVRGPDKTDWFYDYAMSRLPYHPQYVRNRTRFDAQLQTPVSFGSGDFAGDSMALLGSQPGPGSVAHARLLTPLDSLRSKPGEKVEAVLEEPLFTADRKLVLPAGTLIEGTVAMTQKARWFHRGGRLRFNFQRVELTPQTAELLATPAETSQFPTQATLSGAESPGAPVSVDKEGEVKATESKTRFIGTLAAVLIARGAGRQDPERAVGGVIVGTRENIGGRTLGGGMGFGLIGTIAAQTSRTAGAALGYYGLAWAVFSTVIARGAEVQFDTNAAIDIDFNQRMP